MFRLFLEDSKLCGSSKGSIPSLSSPVFSSVSPDTKVRTKKSPRLWHKPVSPVSLPPAQKFCNGHRALWSLYSQRSDKGSSFSLATGFSGRPIPSDKCWFSGFSKIKVLKHQFMESNQFGLTQSKKNPHVLKCQNPISLTTRWSLENWQKQASSSYLYLMVSENKHQIYWEGYFSWIYGWSLIFGQSWTFAFRFVTISLHTVKTSYLHCA